MQVLIFYLLFSLLISCQGTQSTPTYRPTFPDFDDSLRRYGASDELYQDYFECRQFNKLAKVIESRKSNRFVSPTWVFKNRKCKDFFADLYKTHASVENREATIPKKIHQIWLGSPVPEKFKELMGSWQGWEGWEYKLWTDADVELFKLHNQRLYDQALNYGERSDILRYEILYREGGLYVDVDFQCLNPDFFKYAHSHYDLYAGVEPLEASSLLLCNALIASAPGHPLLNAIILEMEAHYVGVYDQSLGQFNTLATTGPRYFTKQFLRRELHDNQVDIAFPTTFFYPLTCEELHRPPDEYASFLKSESCAIHWWSGSWRNSL